MSAPTTDEVFDALRQHPALLTKVAHQAALLLVDEWVVVGDYGARFHNRYLACTPRTTSSRVCWVQQLDGDKWMAVTGSGRKAISDTLYDTAEEAKAAADESIRRMGYIVLDSKFNALRGGPSRRTR
jgi:hypothetical protein